MHCFNIETAVADVRTPIPAMSLATGISIQPLFDQYIEPDFIKNLFCVLQPMPCKQKI